MKFVVIFALISLAAASNENELTEKITRYGKECEMEAGVTLADYDAHPEPRNIQCMVFCIYKKLGMMNEEGRLMNDKNAKKAVAFLLNGSTTEEEVAGRIIDKCNGEVGSDDCETAYAYYTCLETESEKSEDSSE